MFEVVGFFRRERSTSKGRRIVSALALVATLFGLLLLASEVANAKPNWTLDPANSTLTYQSVKKNTIVETNKIRNLSGTLTADGAAKVIFDLNSVDTGIDLRNVRMRFLFFETFKFPTAEVTAKVDPAAFADLATKRRMTAQIPFRLSLHGVDKDLVATAVVTMITDSMVSIASDAPVAVHVEDFGLLPNVEKLQQAANVSSIVPTASVSFDFVFTADGAKQAPPPAVAAATGAATEVGPVATDAAKTTFSDDECMNRFEVLSRTGAIYFRPASARLDEKSRPLLAEVVDVVGKCPKLKVEVSGHTDSDGSPTANKNLSERRAKAVAAAIVAAGIPSTQIAATGYGEERPVAPNDTPKNKALNRRIEFSATPLVN